MGERAKKEEGRILADSAFFGINGRTRSIYRGSWD